MWLGSRSTICGQFSASAASEHDGDLTEGQGQHDRVVVLIVGVDLVEIGPQDSHPAVKGHLRLLQDLGLVHCLMMEHPIRPVGEVEKHAVGGRGD